MIRFEHSEPAIFFNGKRKFKLVNIYMTAKVIDPDANMNCIIEYDNFTEIDKRTFDSPEEAQMYAAIEGIVEAETHLPILSPNSRCSFNTNCRLFPINSQKASEMMHDRLMHFDMFEPFAND